jgi:hypothetical protein
MVLGIVPVKRIAGVFEQVVCSLSICIDLGEIGSGNSFLKEPYGIGI